MEELQQLLEKFEKRSIDQRVRFAEAVRELVMLSMDSTFHTESQTHIIFHLGPGPRIKAYAEWADEAFADFKNQLETVVEKASIQDLYVWRALLEDATWKKKRNSAK